MPYIIKVPSKEKLAWTEEKFAGNYQELVPYKSSKNRELIEQFEGII
jgi:hypothetical protein